MNLHFGNVFTSDTFYRDNAQQVNELLAKYKVLAIEMETTALYTLAAKFDRQALSILTVSDHILTGDRKSTRLNSSHVAISYAVFCMKKKMKDSMYNLTKKY